MELFMKNRLQGIVSKFKGKKILVLGDVMLDQYIWGEVSRISPEAPVPVVEVKKVSYHLGGAANVAMNIASLGGKVYLVGVVGDDQEAEWIKQTFLDNGIDIQGVIVDPGRPTTLKTRIIAHSQQMVRVDREKTDSISDAIAQELFNYSLEVLDDVNAVLISDYAKGITVPYLLKQLIDAARERSKIIVVDPKGNDYSKYRKATVVTPNKQEAAQAVNGEITDEVRLLHIGRTLLKELSCEAVLITRSEEGMSLFQSNGDISHLPASSREVYDVIGAGDTVVGTFTLALTTGAERVDCARIANCAAGIVVSKVGTSTVSIQELAEGVISLR